MTARSARDQDVHVVREGKVWVVLYRGTTLGPRYLTQREAHRAGQVAARQYRCDLVLHGRNGRIRQKDSYGEDSPRRKG